MWGAEMGANEVQLNIIDHHFDQRSNLIWSSQAGVVIGNEAVWNRLSGPQDLHPRLLGMDLLR